MQSNSTDPGAAALRAATVRDPLPNATQLTPTQVRQSLDSVIEWLAPALTPSQLAQVRAVNITIADMNPQRALGLTLASNLIVIDDDGTGLDWSLNGDPDSESGYDLEAVLAHELLHTLGAEHVDSENSLTSDILDPQESLDSLFLDLNWLN